MNVIEKTHVEDCFNGSAIWELLLSGPVSRPAIFSLGDGGDIQYFSHFARPFFKVRVDGLFDVKGIEGNNTLRVHLKAPGEYTLEHFIDRLKTTGSPAGQ